MKTDQTRHAMALKKLLLLSATLGLAGPLAGGAALAAETQAKSGVLEEIVVTARRREEGLETTPVSITAFTATDLAARQIDNISQISDSTPNLVFDSTAPISGSNAASSIFIRGVGQTDFTLVTDPGVGLYLDGVYIARSVGGVLELVDVERVEVLRGPQGTLFGKNTIGGAINITSRRPGNDFAGTLEVKTGTGDRIDVKGSVDLPLSDMISLRLSYANLNQDGYVKNLGGGPNLSDTNAQVARAVIDIHPDDNLSILIAGDYTRRREQARAQKILAFNPFAPAPTFGPFAPIAGILGVPNYDDRFLAGGPFVTHQGTSEDMVPVSNLDVYGISMTVDYDFGAASLKSITAYRKFDSKFGRDTDNSPFVIVETFDDMNQDQFSQELQLSGVSMDSRLNWLAGVYYFEEQGDNLNLVRTTVLDIKSGGAVKNDSWAGFGHVSFAVTEQLNLNLGGRYTRDKKRFTPDQQVLFNQYTLPVFGGAGFTDGQRILPMVQSSATFNDFSLSAGLDYQWTDGLMTYLSYSEGFKSGGFNQRVFPPRAVPGSFKPERVAVYEGGWKWGNEAKTVRFNGAVFYTDYKDIQVKIIDVVAPGTGNAAKGRVWGGELELTALPVPELLLQAGAGYLNTKYTRFGAAFDPAQGIDLNDRFVNSPKWSLSASAAYTIDLGNLGDVTLRIDWSYRAKVYNDAANSEAIAQKGLNLINAGVTFVTTDEAWQLAFNVRNLTDKTYLVTGNDEFNGFGYIEGIYARPREWSLALKRRF